MDIRMAKYTLPDKPMVIVTSAPLQGPLHVLLVGAGGNGARVMPPLMQMLRPGDAVAVIDHDIVEDRNLARQHFTERDIGRHKAIVLAERYRRSGIHVTAFAQQVTAETAPQLLVALNHAPNRVWISCVDNWQARASIRGIVDRLGSNTAWIDVGNEMRGGQVLMSLRSWVLRVSGLATISGASNVRLSLDAFHAMPQLLRAQSWNCIPCGIRNAAGADSCTGCHQPQASCGQRIDLQTVMVNHMAAASAINCLSWLMLGIPFTSCGAFFSTLNTMQPIPITGCDSIGNLLPDTTFALPDEA